MAGGGLALGGLTHAARMARAEPASPHAPSEQSVGAPVLVLTGDAATQSNPRARSWAYISEVLKRGGVFFETLTFAGLASLSRRPRAVVVLAGNVSLGSEQVRLLSDWVREGGALVGIGGTSGLDEVFGVTSQMPMGEGWIKVIAEDHPVTSGLRSSLHVFGGVVVKGGPATRLAEIDSGHRLTRTEIGNRVTGGGVVSEHEYGKGRALLLSADLLFSIVHIQQGLPILQDGKAPDDRFSRIDDGSLKAEDSLVLDWRRDRQTLPPDDGPLFLEPITDELRELVLRGIFHVARQQEVALPVLWYWPGELKAIGHISHDSDFNEPEKGAALLGHLNRCQVKSTWCILYPGGYASEFYRQLSDQGFEIALHYDAMTGGEKTSWSKENFQYQHNWLRGVAGVDRITTVKNHYTRWEGRLDFFRWCEEVGIIAEQTRGPSKRGVIGFPLGGSQPYFPLDDETAPARFLKVLEVNMMTQDLGVVCPVEWGSPLLDSALRHNGVGHFLFHPNHILGPGVMDAMSNLVDTGRSRGLEWWPCVRIYEWEAARRAVTARFDPSGSATLTASSPLRQATVMWLSPSSSASARAITVNGQVASSSRREMHGFAFDAVTLDIEGDVNVRVA